MKYKCIADGPWFQIYNKIVTKGFWFWRKTSSIQDKKNAKGPSKDEIVTWVSEHWTDGELYYDFLEWPNIGSYNAKHFIPYNEDTAKEEVKEEMVEVTYEKIKKEVPISAN